MEYRIETMDAFGVVGIGQFVPTAGNQNQVLIPQMWQNLKKETVDQLLALTEGKLSGLLGICADMTEGGFEYWIAVASSKPCPPQFKSMQIPAATWAVFTAIGPMPHAIQKLWAEIYGTWFPTSGYEHAHLPEIEWYSNGDPSDADYVSEVWIPVIKK